MPEDNKYKKGRGSQYNSANPFSERSFSFENIEGLDEEYKPDATTTFFKETPKTIVNKVTSPDLGMAYSLNPYQGCEHGCIYCYARNSHQYWGYSAGLDFENKIIVKENAPALLEKFLCDKKWQAHEIAVSGNTDCYQPAERNFTLTRKILEVFLKYKHPVSIITKNSLVLRDLDILKKLNDLSLVHVNISITSLDETLRQKLEPRTSTSLNRLKTIGILSAEGIPVNVMVAPVIPGLNNHEIPSIIEKSAVAGALSAAYTIVRLNGTVKDLFKDWVQKAFPARAEKIIHQIEACHGGKLNDSRFGVRMKGEGEIAETIKALFKIACKKHFKGKSMPSLNYTSFEKPSGNQLKLF